MKLLTTEQLAEIDKRHEALTQWYANADKERGFHKGKAGAENQSHHDRKALRGHITALESEIKDHAKWAECMFSDPSSEPYRKLLDHITALEAKVIDEKDSCADSDMELGEANDIVIPYLKQTITALEAKLEKVGQAIILCDSTDPNNPVMDGNLYRKAIVILEDKS